MINLKDRLFSDFLNFLTPQSISDFFSECKNYQTAHHIKESTPKISRQGFMTIMKKLFPQCTTFNDLFTYLFNRFRCQKCIITNNSGKESFYSLLDITSTDKINIYNVSVALVFFCKCEFKVKMKMLFELTDLDNDGFIAQKEVEKMFFTANLIFIHEEGEFKLDSNIVQQSLGYIKGNKAYNMVMYHPGGLMDLILNEKCVDFDQFYAAIQRVPNYKFCLVPFLVSMKECLKTVKDEKEFSMNGSVSEDFVSISTDMIRSSNLRKDNKRINLRKVINKYVKKNILENGFNSGLSRSSSITKLNNQTNTSSDTISILTGTSRFTKSKIRVSKELQPNKSMCSIGKIDYEKLCHIEVPPCKIRPVLGWITKNSKERRESKNNSTFKSFNKKTLLPKLSIRKLKKDKRSSSCSDILKPTEEIKNDIDSIISRRGYDEQNFEKLKNIEKEIDKRAKKMKDRIMNKSTLNQDFKMDLIKESELKNHLIM